MKRAISLVIAVMLVFSSFVTAYAYEQDDAAKEQEYSNDNTNDKSFTETSYAADIDESNDNAPDYPVITSITTANNGVKITWSAFDSAYKYRLFYKTSSGWKTITTTSNLSYTHTGLQNYANYTYTVRVVNSDGSFGSSYYKNGWSHIYLKSPVMKSLTCTTDGMKVSWDAVYGAKNYKVYKKTTGSWTAIGYTTGTSFVDKNAVSGTTYTYTVRCVSEDGTQFTSYHTSGIKGTYVATPQISKVENTANGAKVTWSKVSGATKYRLFYKVSGGWKTIANTTSTSYTHSNLSNQSTYTYTVRAMNSKNQYISSYNSKGTTNTFLSVPKLNSVSSVFGGMKINFTAVSGAKNYKVYVKTATSWKALGTTSTNSFIDTTATSGKAHTYTVRCVADDLKTWTSYFDKKGITGTYVASPVINDVSNTATGAKISWDKVEGASKYKVFYKTATSWKTIATTQNCTYTHSKLNSHDVYTYTVRACNSGGSYISGYDSKGVTNTFIAPITIAYSTNINNHPLLYWPKESQAYGYRLYIKTIDGEFEKLCDTRATTYIDQNPPADIPYTYTMRCIDENGNTINYYISDTKYYYNGFIADGDIHYNGNVYKFDNGYLRQGFVIINDKRYYYNEDGEMVKNRVVGNDTDGYYYANFDGICCESEEMRLAAQFIAKNTTGSTNKERMKTGFSYLALNYPYKRSYDHPKQASDMPDQAIDMFKDKEGNCFKYAAAFACIAKASGYRSRVVIGTTPGFGTWTPHGWTEVYVDSKWLVCDPDFQMMYPSIEYYYYMTNGSRVPVKETAKFEIVIEDSQAIWK